MSIIEQSSYPAWKVRVDVPGFESMWFILFGLGSRGRSRLFSEPLGAEGPCDALEAVERPAHDIRCFLMLAKMAS